MSPSSYPRGLSSNLAEQQKSVANSTKVLLTGGSHSALIAPKVGVSKGPTYPPPHHTVLFAPDLLSLVITQQIQS
eukprot:scaffold306377_cov14-Tisochrysis_lutea.AAC.1